MEYSKTILHTFFILNDFPGITLNIIRYGVMFWWSFVEIKEAQNFVMNTQHCICYAKLEYMVNNNLTLLRTRPTLCKDYLYYSLDSKCRRDLLQIKSNKNCNSNNTDTLNIPSFQTTTIRSYNNPMNWSEIALICNNGRFVHNRL